MKISKLHSCTNVPLLDKGRRHSEPWADEFRDREKLSWRNELSATVAKVAPEKTSDMYVAELSSSLLSDMYTLRRLCRSLLVPPIINGITREVTFRKRRETWTDSVWQQHERCPHYHYNPTGSFDVKCFGARSEDADLGDFFGTAVMSGGVLPTSELT